MNKVSSGDPLRIPAETFNTFVDASQDFLNRRHGVRLPGPATGYDGTILIRNDSGSDLDRFSVLGIADYIITYPDGAGLSTFKNQPVIAGVVPNGHQGKFVILAEPARNGAIVRAHASGVVPVKLDMKTGGTLADVKDGETGYLEASETGTAQIVWKQYTTGSGGWGLVRLPFDFGPHRLSFDGIARIDSAYPDSNFSGGNRITQSGDEGTRRQAFLLHAEHPFRREDFVSASVAYAAQVTVTRANCGGWGDWLKSSVQAVSFIMEDFDVEDVTWNTAPDRTSPESARSAPVMMRYPNALTAGVNCVLISVGQYVDAGILAQQIISAPSGADIYYGLWVEPEAGSYPAPWWTSYECQTDCDRADSRVLVR